SRHGTRAGEPRGPPHDPLMLAQGVPARVPLCALRRASMGGLGPALAFPALVRAPPRADPVTVVDRGAGELQPRRSVLGKPRAAETGLTVNGGLRRQRSETDKGGCGEAGCKQWSHGYPLAFL